MRIAWQSIEAPHDAEPPAPLTVRAQSIPARALFPDHQHAWHQMVYAISGVLTVVTDGRSFAISPEQAVWLPSGSTHRVGSLMGAEFRSLWIAEDVGRGLRSQAGVFAVSPLLRELIVEAAALTTGGSDNAYRGRVTALILDQLAQARALPGALPWPQSHRLNTICEAIYADPADPRGPEEWGRDLGMSGRTLARRFEAELGMSLRSWRRRLRLFRALEMLGGGVGVTQTAMALGYGSTSAFVYAFRREMGCSPGAHLRRPSN